jgi:hypothetical protein
MSFQAHKLNCNMECSEIARDLFEPVVVHLKVSESFHGQN